LKRKKKTINDRLSEIKILAATRSNLNNSKYELNDAQEFQFLRSNEERENDIGAVENNIIRWRNEIAQLERK
jgi:hypothetical protein